MVIRVYQEGDLPGVQQIYINAFAGFPWFESLELDEIQRRMAPDLARDTFTCLVAQERDAIVATSWGVCMTMDELANSRGADLCEAIREASVNRTLFWERELIVDPSVQGQGVGSTIRKAFLDFVETLYSPALLLTRMRDDNIGTLKIAERLGFIPTGITRPASEKPGQVHQFHMKLIG